MTPAADRAADVRRELDSLLHAHRALEALRAGDDPRAAEWIAGFQEVIAQRERALGIRPLDPAVVLEHLDAATKGS